MTGAMRPTSLTEAIANRDCEKKNLSQNGINECELDLFVMSEVALTDAYNRAVPAVAKFERPAQEDAKTDIKESFVKSQQAWCAYRGASCIFDSDSLEGGSMEPGISFSCRRKRNEARIKALNVLTTCYTGGDCQTPPLLYMYELFPDDRP